MLLGAANGVPAIYKFKRVRFFNAIDLFNILKLEKVPGELRNLADQLCLIEAVGLDELDYLSFSAFSGVLLSHLISQLYEKNVIDYHNLSTVRRIRVGIR